MSNKEEDLKAINELVNRFEGSPVFVNKYIVVAEGMDSDGNRSLYTSTSEDATSWDALGMLAWCTGRENARIINASRDE